MRRPPRGWPLFWYVLTAAVTAVVVLGVLSVIAFFVVFAVAANSYASNK